MLDTKILYCVDKNGELVELPLTSDFCTYKLNLCQEERKCIITVDLKIKTSLDVDQYFIFVQLVKCAENIGMNRFDDDYKIGEYTQINFFCSKYGENAKNENNYPLREFNLYTESRKGPREHYKNYVDFRVRCYCIGKRNKLETIKQFRKELGKKEIK
ncbi:hypothetical protein CDIK_2880 [Cucumispora dikerogammari]|nr:hypothetical protein CDIK_2880 [Cucumispora dikerogammari]